MQKTLLPVGKEGNQKKELKCVELLERQENITKENAATTTNITRQKQPENQEDQQKWAEENVKEKQQEKQQGKQEDQEDTNIKTVDL